MLDGVNLDGAFRECGCAFDGLDLVDIGIDEGLVGNVDPAELEAVIYGCWLQSEGDFPAGMEGGAFEGGGSSESVLGVGGHGEKRSEWGDQRPEKSVAIRGVEEHGRLVRALCEFRVVDESADWIVVEKPAPLMVHPASGRFDEPTLLSGLQQLLAFELANGAGLSILTRLDRETSGLVLVAKNRRAAGHFSKQLQRCQIEKEYLAVVHGWPEWEEREEQGPIVRAGEVGESEIWLRQRVHAEGRKCVTRFRVERRFENSRGRFSILGCFPETGRMHQIRVHLEHLAHPIVGDKVYGDDGRAYLERVAGGMSEATRERLILSRHALHATRLTAEWEGRRLEWSSELPGDLARFVKDASVGERDDSTQ